MAGLTQEQLDFLQVLKSWVESSDVYEEIFKEVVNRFKDQIRKTNKDQKRKSIHEILLNKLNNEINYKDNSQKTTISRKAIHYIKRQIQYGLDDHPIFGRNLFRYLTDPDNAKAQLVSQAINFVFPSEVQIKMELENMILKEKIDNLIVYLDSWIADLKDSNQYSERKIEAIKAKYSKYKKEYHDNSFFCSICVLSNYVDKPEEAKAFLAEILTKRQESFYKNLEKWAEYDIEDKECGKWIALFLFKGRDLRIHKIKVLRYINDEESAKRFLLSKYEEKLEWDRKKSEARKEAKKAREYKHKSVFDDYTMSYGATNSLMPNIGYGTKLYSICISSNVDDLSKYSFLSASSGFEIYSDSIDYNIEHLSLSSFNRLYYAFMSTYKKHTKYYTIYSSLALDIIKDYIRVYINDIDIKSVVGCITVRESINDKLICYTSLLTTKEADFSANARFIYTHYKESDFWYEKIGYAFAQKAFIWYLMFKTKSDIDFSPNNAFTENDRNQIYQYIDDNYERMSYDQRYICTIINSTRYAYPQNEVFVTRNQKQYLLDRILNLKQCICSQYGSKVLDDHFFQYARIYYIYGDTNFDKLVQSIGKSIRQNNYTEIWSDTSNKYFLSTLRVLLFTNWVYVSNKKGSIKKITACWLLSIISNCLKNTFPKDQNFWTILMAYVLLENSEIFNKILQFMGQKGEILESYNIVDIAKSLLSKSGQSLRITSEQRMYLCNNYSKCSFFRLDKPLTVYKFDTCKSLIDKLNSFLSSYIYADDKLIYNNELLDILSTLPEYELPSNFINRENNHRHSYYDKYNGDYSGTYAHDVAGLSNDEIDTILEGDPDAYWNID